MDRKTAELLRLMDQAIELAQERLSAKQESQNDQSSVEGLEEIISALQYRRGEAVNPGYEVSDSYLTLGLSRAALEYEAPDSELLRKIGEVEQYFLQHFVRSATR